MRLSSLSLAVILLFSFPLSAQHSSGGGGSSGSSSSGGGSHSASSSSGGSSSTHSSSSSHSSASVHNSGSGGSHSSNLHAPNTAMSARSGLKHPEQSARFSNQTQAVHPPAPQIRAAQPEKRTFFSFLRHPFHKPHPKPVADLRRPVCFRGPCLACPAGTASANGGCTSLGFVRRERVACSSWEVWSGGACLAHTYFLSDCDSQRRAVEQQGRRMQSADAAQRNACSAGETQECTSARDQWRSEQNFYQSLQTRYRQCQQQSVTYFPYRFGGNFFSMYEPGLFLDPMLVNLNY